MKKIFALVLVISMMAGFAACGSSEPTTQIGESADKSNKIGPAFSDITISKQEEPKPNTDNEKPVADQSLAKTVGFETNMGTFEVTLYPETPIASKNLIDKASSGFYNNLIFHRIMKGFMIQGGDPTGTGAGGGNMDLDKKQLTTGNKKGTISMASSRAGVNQSDCQFFINTNDNTSGLDSQGFIAFGQVTKGYEIVEKIENSPVGASERGELSKPIEKVYIIKTYVK
jgi:cyclophilin family peptidyl-prolyl cis-trans isomerase